MTCRTQSVIALACLAALFGCRQPEPKPLAWAAETGTSAVEINAVVRVSQTAVTVGARIDVTLEVRSLNTAKPTDPVFRPAGLEPVDFIASPATLDDAGRQLRQFHWIMQAGAPQTVSAQALRINDTLILTLPTIVIRSSLGEDVPADALPPMEEHDAL